MSVAFSPDGSRIAAGTGQYDYGSGRVIVFSSSDGSVIWESEGLDGSVNSVAFSPDGSKIVVGIGWSSYPDYHGRVIVFSVSGLQFSITATSMMTTTPTITTATSLTTVVTTTATSSTTTSTTSSIATTVASYKTGSGFSAGSVLLFVPVVVGVGLVGFVVVRRRGGRGVVVAGRGGTGTGGSSGGPGPGLGGGDASGDAGGVGGGSGLVSRVSEAFARLRSGRDVGFGSSVLEELENACASGSGGDVCSKLDELRSLVVVVRNIESNVSVGRDGSRPLIDRVEALESALSGCKWFGIECGDIESQVRDLRSELEAEVRRVASLIVGARKALAGGRVSEALSILSKASEACERLGDIEVCSDVRPLRSAVEAVIDALRSSRVFAEASPAGSVLGIVVEVPALAAVPPDAPPVRASVASLPDGLSVVGSYPEASLAGGEGTVLRLGVRASSPGSYSVPVDVCWGDYCVERVVTLEVSTPPRPSVPKRPVRVSVADARRLLGLGLEGLVGGYGCVGESFAARLRRGIVPEGFEGEAECCRLGCGGWGCAYLCRRGGDSFVVKVPRGFEGIVEGGFAPTVHERLLRKIGDTAEAVRALRHPNVLRLLGVAEHAPVLVYEFAEHGSLEWQLVRGWRPSLRDVVLVGIQVGDALRYIHSRGLVHGDVKPGNVFVVGGVAKVGDFSSLVRLVTMSSRMSRFAYTPGFRAPEQAFADLRRRVRELGIENRIDVYLLGNLLLYLLTGESVDGEEAIGTDAVEEAVAGVEDEDLRRLIASALTTEPEERPTMDEVVRELLRIWISRGW